MILFVKSIFEVISIPVVTFANRTTLDVTLPSSTTLANVGVAVCTFESVPPSPINLVAVTFPEINTLPEVVIEVT